MSPVQSKAQAPGLGNRHLLDKIDKLRELGISKQVPLPQLVVVGDQSSGKSSVLESLTGYYFPRSVGLCTRNATEIVCRRESEASIVVTIHPVEASPEKEELAKSFRHVLQDLKGDEFAEVLEKASEVMGLKLSADDSFNGMAFSKDILRVEICGPEEEHLTIIDVPGIFENPQEGFTTSEDVAMVKTMVKEYIKDSRTIILAVIPSNVDVATQTILTYAAEADPEGKRTLGVLTKPDLVNEIATRQAVMGLVKGQRRDIQLGYYVVKNRGADDTSSSKEDRDTQERIFFAEEPWSKLDKSRLGIPALRNRLRELLMDRTKSEFPKVRRDINDQLTRAQAQIEELGKPRGTAEEQRAYLGRVVSRFTELKNFGLNAYYSGDPLFEKNPELKLITRVREMNTAFSDVLFTNGHTRNFQDSDAGTEANNAANNESYEDYDPYEDDACRDDLYELRFMLPKDQFGELDEVLSEPCRCSPPKHDDIIKNLGELFLNSRGYELGTFGSHMLPSAFKDQSTKWEPVTVAHVSNVILVVHHFIRGLVHEACGDSQVREALWSFILEDLIKRYRRAIDHAQFLINVEREGRTITYNPAFDRALSRFKIDRSAKMFALHKQYVEIYDGNLDCVLWADLAKAQANGKGLDETCIAIHDALKSYYEIAVSRFVDTVCTQAVDHFLLAGEEGPLASLTPNRIFEMSAEQLEMIAGEDPISKSTREMLTKDIKALKKAKIILRG